MDRLLQIGLENALTAGILGLVVFAVGKSLRQPPLLHLLWVVVLLKLLLPPLLVPPFSWTGMMGRELRPLEVPHHAAAPSLPLPPPSTSEPPRLPEAPGEVSPRSVDAAHLPAAGGLSLLDASLWLWLLGAAVMLAVAAVRTVRFEVLLRDAAAAPAEVQGETASLASRLGVSRPPTVLLLPSSLSPALWVMGRRRRIVFPAALWDRLGGVERRALLAHELAHLRRRDHWVRWLELAATVVYWWHPVVWWARREIEKHEEECCDAWVLWALPEAQGAYGRALVETVEHISRHPGPLPALASGMAGAGEIQRRLTAILRGRSPRMLSRVGRVVVAGVGALALVHVRLAALPEEAAAPGGTPTAIEVGKEKQPVVQQNEDLSGEQRTRPEAPPEPSALAAAAARRGLDWLHRHQSPDGSWKAADFIRQCKTPCRNADAQRYGDGRGFADHDIGVTGLAMLAFAGYGHSHREGVNPQYVACLQQAVAFMKKAQVRSNDSKTAGRYGPGTGEQWVYDHAIATRAMGELLVMSRDVIGLERSVTDAVKLCLLAQNDGFGWRYGIKPGDNDTSVTGWMVLALKTAKSADLDIPKEEFDRAFRGAINWLDRATASNGKTGYMAPGDEGARLASVHPDPYPYSKDLSCMTAVGVFCRLRLGEARKSESILQGVDILMKETPRWQEQKGRALSTINMYHWYYGSLAMFQFGGALWKKWNEDLTKALLESQRRGAICEDGSWDPIDEWGPAGGRVASTALAVMTLRFGGPRE